VTRRSGAGSSIWHAWRRRDASMASTPACSSSAARSERARRCRLGQHGLGWPVRDRRRLWCCSAYAVSLGGPTAQAHGCGLTLCMPTLATCSQPGVGTAIWAGEAGMPPTVRLAAGACSLTQAAPSTATCIGEIGNDFTSNEGRSAAAAIALLARTRPVAAAMALVVVTAPAAAIAKRTRLPDLLNEV